MPWIRCKATTQRNNPDVGVRVIASPAPAQQEMDLPPGGGKA